MAELIDFSNDKFWDILFDEACVEGGQAKRIEKKLKEFATTEADIRAKAIDKFAKVLNEKIGKLVVQHKEDFKFASGLSLAWNMVDEVAEKLKGSMG